MSDNIENKINELTVVSKSQLDRNLIKEESFKNLMGFLNGYISQSNTQSALKIKVENMLLDKLDQDQEDVPYGVLIKLHEILSKTETDSAIPILKIIESATRNDKDDVPRIPEGSSKNESSMTSKDITTIKKLLTALGDLKESEFPEEEK